MKFQFKDERSKGGKLESEKESSREKMESCPQDWGKESMEKLYLSVCYWLAEG